MTADPYSPPKSNPSSGPGRAGWQPDVGEAPFLWKACFALLLGSILLDVGIVANRLQEGRLDGLPSTVAIFGLIALAQFLMVLSIRWILFRLILRRRRPGDIRGAVPLLGVVVIFAMVKLIENQGFRLWLETGSLPKFVVFLVPSLALVVLMNPARLADFHSGGRHIGSVAEDREPSGSILS